jgi:hypothetical protein
MSFDPDHFDRLVEEAVQRNAAKDVGRLGAGPNRRADRPMPLGGA